MSIVTAANTSNVATFTQSFKTDKSGFKRESVTVTYVKPDIDAIKTEVANKILEHSLISYAKKLFIENSGDKNYCPSVDDLTIENLYLDITSPSNRGKRFLTLEKINNWTIEFASLATTAGKSQSYISVVEKLAKEKFKSLVMHQDKALKLCEFLLQLEFADSTNELVNEKLCEILSEIVSSAQTDEISLDSLD